MSEVRKLEVLPSLQELSLYGNTVTRAHEYRLLVAYRMQSLIILDGISITEEEKLRAEMYALEQHTMLQQMAYPQGYTQQGYQQNQHGQFQGWPGLNSQTGTLEILASSNQIPEGTSAASLLIARAHPAAMPLAAPAQASSAPIKINNVNLFNVTHNTNYNHSGLNCLFQDFELSTSLNFVE